MTSYRYFYLNLLISLNIASGSNKITIPMRVVKDTASYSFIGGNVNEIGNQQLVSDVKPSNFSGPILLKRLIGKCYNLTQDSYRYVLCPFQNITQYEISTRWNAYQGVLGVWNEWNIENNTFQSMTYSHGDHCGDIDRTVQVYLKCGAKEILANVTEPKRCQYAAIFITKYVCHKDALLVYPRINAELQKQWDELLTEFHYGDITEKGYQLGLEKIFNKAGFSGTKSVGRASNTTVTTAAPEMISGSTFSDLQSCNKEYSNLQKEVSELHQEIEALRLALDLKNVENRTNKPHR